MANVRTLRREQFLGPTNGGWASLSAEVSECALALLDLAFEDRAKNVFRMVDNHYSPHALGSLVLVTTAFDAWLSEAVACFDPFCSSGLRALGEQRFDVKLAGLLQDSGAREWHRAGELELLANTRNEVVHYLPRGVNAPGNVPEWLSDLDRLGLLLSTGRSHEFTFDQRLGSFKLAHWAWELTSSAADTLVSAAGDRRVFIDGTSRNFARFRRLPPPSDFPKFDAENGLAPTVVQNDGR
ncbi:MAG: hypothetical protein IT348_04380 [Candidatus Eisenbacteria bacterium]|nr:hypothetical protein [Candidatus Eisenbacteria bacterium]